MIEEDDPEITVDTVEDVESHSDDCDDDVKQIGALVHVSMNEASPWAPGYNVVGDKLQRNIYSKRIEQKSVTSACGNNLGKLRMLRNVHAFLGGLWLVICDFTKET